MGSGFCLPPRHFLSTVPERLFLRLRLPQRWISSARRTVLAPVLQVLAGWVPELKLSESLVLQIPAAFPKFPSLCSADSSVGHRMLLFPLLEYLRGRGRDLLFPS